jgi:type VI secretion system protein ImpC
MDANLSFGKIRFEFALGSDAQGRRPDPEVPFRLLVAGDFSGRSSRAVQAPLSRERLRHVDCDNFEQVMARLEAGLRLDLPISPDRPVELRFSNVDDFHPEHLCRQVLALRELLEQRRRLLDPATAAATAGELAPLLQNRPAPAPPQAAAVAAAESDRETLDRLLGSPPASAAAPQVSARPALAQLIHAAVASSAVPGATAQQTAILSALELDLASRLRAVLHHPQLQALEASWRGLDLLIRNFGAEENIKLYLLDISKEELAADLMAQPDLEQSSLCRLLKAGAEDAPWALAVALFTFANTAADIQLLGRLAKISAALGAPFLGSGSPAFVGCDSFAARPDPDDWTLRTPAETAAAWQALRALPESAYLGLVLPRFLLRQPYGKGSDPIEAFPFEELEPERLHEHCLWGNPALVSAYLLAAAFQAEGWDMRPEGYGELTDLPVYQFREDGETRVKPCAEAWLSDRAADAILAAGLMPLLSIKGRDAVRLFRMQSVQAGGRALAGRWG